MLDDDGDDGDDDGHAEIACVDALFPFPFRLDADLIGCGGDWLLLIG